MVLRINGGSATAMTLAAALLYAGAAAADARTPFMELGPKVAPPRGYLDFCSRAPSQCPSQAKDLEDGASAGSNYWRMLFASVEPASYGRSRRPSDRPGPVGRQPAPAAAPSAQDGQRRTVVLTPVAWRQLNDVNRQVNARIRSSSDRETYGVNDYWALALERNGRYGDCEDYVLEKRRALRDSGYSDEVLSIALVRTGWGQDHAVLLVSTDRGELVLDSLSPWVSSWRDVGYTWMARQSPLEPGAWVAGADFRTLR